jgi:hypothetical protein
MHQNHPKWKFKNKNLPPNTRYISYERDIKHSIKKTMCFKALVFRMQENSFRRIFCTQNAMHFVVLKNRIQAIYLILKDEVFDS